MIQVVIHSTSTYAAQSSSPSPSNNDSNLLVLEFDDDDAHQQQQQQHLHPLLQDYSLATLKAQIEKHFGIPPEQQHLVWEGKELTSTTAFFSQELLLGCCSSSTTTTLIVIFLFSPQEWNSRLEITFKKLPIGQEISLVVSPQETISHLKQRIHLIQSCSKADGGNELFCPGSSSNIIANESCSKPFSFFDNCSFFRLMHQGKVINKEEENQTLDEAEIKQGAVVSIAPSKKAFHCAVEECFERVVKVIGDCVFCGGRFCSSHRLPESHLCSNLQSCKQQSFENNHSKVMKGKCVAGKVL